MKSYCLRQHKILKLHLLFITIVVFLLSANVSYGDIFVELVHVDTTQYPTIQAYVTVTDENGDLITDLTESNFSISEDGNAQPVESATLFPPPIDPIAVALPLDYSDSMVEANAIEDMKTAALLFIDLLRDDFDDACEIIKFSTIVKVEQPFTTDKDDLRDAVERPWTEDPNGTMLYDAVYNAIEDTASYIDSQDILGSVVVASDGRENASSHTLGDVIFLAVFYGIKIYTVGLGDVDEEVLQQMADETGGRYFYAANSSDLETIYHAIVTEHCGGYVVSYTTSTTGCEDHSLQISVTKNAEFGEDSKSFLICPQYNGGGGTGSSENSSGWDVCFIATAAFGSYLDPHVEVLRDFRDNHLFPSPIGRALMEFYYKTSPPIADYIKRHETLRKVTRCALIPLVFTIKNPIIIGIIIGIGGLAAIVIRKRVV
ncbi:hypothetical protein AMJ44_10015 [candidate division WOR-1 bacterium DG_54_3]|uniref:VWFA domain-containing protein n=1 Tax=candidate division WOR-1 bacterium DG_54_3 TaxID=1703775 RepID=A0A0S7XST0_UNCSA|nr:MAG: hypothetical protein AMJ44_10015 [candidate division WOR-1 bacterium DG_54_3]